MIDDEKRLNATYIISVARKLGCSIFLLPEDIMEVRLQLGACIFLSCTFHCTGYNYKLTLPLFLFITLQPTMIYEINLPYVNN